MALVLTAGVLVAEAKTYIVDDAGQFVPILAAPTIGVFGVEAKHTFRERLAVTATTFALDEILVQTLKHTIRSRRPDGSDNHSFPSGHMARATAGAEIIRSEYGWAWGAGAYAWAAGIGALRIHHHRHRFGDVVGGAVTGFVSARLAYLLLPVERRLFGWDKTRVTVTALPAVGADGKSVAAAVNIIF